MADFKNVPLPSKMQDMKKEVERLREYVDLFRKDLAYRKMPQSAKISELPVVVIRKITFSENKLSQNCAKVEFCDGSILIFDEYKTQNGFRYVERGSGAQFEICEGSEEI